MTTEGTWKGKAVMGMTELGVPHRGRRGQEEDSCAAVQGRGRALSCHPHSFESKSFISSHPVGKGGSATHTQTSIHPQEIRGQDEVGTCHTHRHYDGTQASHLHAYLLCRHHHHYQTSLLTSSPEQSICCCSSVFPLLFFPLVFLFFYHMCIGFHNFDFLFPPFLLTVLLVGGKGRICST